MANKKEYYIRTRGYLGNAYIWWAQDSRGYTSDINKAHRYTLEEALLRATRDYDVVFDCDYIDSLEVAHKTIIDSQYVDDSFIINKTENGKE